MKLLTATLAAALALCVSPAHAQSVRFKTPIANVGDGFAECRIAYFGNVTNIPVTVTLIAYASADYGNQSRLIRSYKLGPLNRAVSLGRTADPPGGDVGLQDMRCVFDVVTNEPGRYMAAACGRGTCLLAR
jgi:hypothetical protein